MIKLHNNIDGSATLINIDHIVKIDSDDPYTVIKLSTGVAVKVREPYLEVEARLLNLRRPPVEVSSSETMRISV